MKGHHQAMKHCEVGTYAAVQLLAGLSSRPAKVALALLRLWLRHAEARHQARHSNPNQTSGTAIKLTQQEDSNTEVLAMPLPSGPVKVLVAGQLRLVPLPKGLPHVPSTLTVSVSTLLVLLPSVRLSCTELTLEPIPSARTE
jgi:hypothetical protein